MNEFDQWSTETYDNPQEDNKTRVSVVGICKGDGTDTAYPHGNLSQVSLYIAFVVELRNFSKDSSFLFLCKICGFICFLLVNLIKD